MAQIDIEQNTAHEVFTVVTAVSCGLRSSWDGTA
jgi:hypothetical protein